MDLFAKPMDLLVITIVAFVFLGPDKFPSMAAKAGQMVRDFKAMAGNMTAEFQAPLHEMQATMDEVRAAVTGIHDETRALTDLVPTVAEIMNLTTGQPVASVLSPDRLSPTPVVALRTPSKADPLADFAHLRS